ncbi:opine/polyamine ABC transporter substrate-binding protein [Komagataeibacter nataicola]|uniref:Opine/polyamine ABC transporter substrate-binding protein n=1 Tax=Komagataeibacter nataicola TaxID=265960 RepID=A0A9N7CFC9_9PROT|nr:extracellular solute-binding protein [Komagataeibacter nataicola]AQU88404.1 opine/polyamine ABC transporter substrate-binding protein [Komagataeibacter nataicola]PYD65209.1 opine/polyamine ABC transporter substrate-binding protein [Komagataeibacter nataicola]WEQ54499.1 extracellular solute-binding protein [Komagataeibacter nataicola]WNM08877.1 extracellular solute-binding protein [Komagataeibacter nataicola]GBR21467.1 spermidine/putrescine-binding periplasmic protein [Komagataeibacter natai
MKPEGGTGRPLTRRSMGRAALATMLAGSLPRGSARGATRSLTISGYAGPFERAFQACVIDPFQQATPGVHIEYRPVMNSAQSLALLSLARTRTDIDIAIMDISVSILATGKDLLAPLDIGQVPALGHIPSWGRPAASHGVAFTRDNLVLVYNTDILGHHPPTSWMDLGRPELVDQVCMPIEDTRGVVLLPLLDRSVGADYRVTIDPALALLRQFAPNVANWNAQPDIYTLVMAQTVALGVGWNARTQMMRARKAGPIDGVVPSEGSVSQINTLNVARGTPDMELACAFVNHALSATVQKRFAQAAFYGPTNSDVVLEPALDSRIYGGPDIAARELYPDWEFISRNYNNWVRRIQREVISG